MLIFATGKHINMIACDYERWAIKTFDDKSTRFLTSSLLFNWFEDEENATKVGKFTAKALKLGN